MRLEGHTNSACGLDCDGSSVCSNFRCARDFGASGGAVAFSERRARAVKEALVALGVDGDRLDVAGLAGSRRVCEDTEDRAGNDKNRRVEIHCA